MTWCLHLTFNKTMQNPRLRRCCRRYTAVLITLEKFFFGSRSFSPKSLLFGAWVGRFIPILFSNIIKKNELDDNPQHSAPTSWRLSQIDSSLWVLQALYMSLYRLQREQWFRALRDVTSLISSGDIPRFWNSRRIILPKLQLLTFNYCGFDTHTYVYTCVYNVLFR